MMHKVVNGVKVELIKEEIAFILKEEEEYRESRVGTEYLGGRIREYPPIEDQLDMLYKDKKDGTSTWFDLVVAIKRKYPKPVV